MKSIRVNSRTNNKYKENKFSFCRREKTSLATREKGWRRRGGERVASSRWRRSFAKGRGGVVYDAPSCSYSNGER